jgi:superfamily II DNA/RNA helicase
VLAAVPARRQTLLFSATFPPDVQALAASLLRDPARVEAASQAAAEPVILQRVISVDPPRRTELLRHLVEQGGWRRVLVFVATRHAAQHVAGKLYARGLYAAPLHGEMSQSQRSEMLHEFRSGGFDLLVTTDLAARGIDVPGLDVVVNYDLPRSPNDYVHRIGRTGRAGASGLAVSFVSAATEPHFRLIEKRQHLALPREQVPGFEPVEVPAPGTDAAAPTTGGITGKRPNKKDKLRAAAAAAAARPDPSSR